MGIIAAIPAIAGIISAIGTTASVASVALPIASAGVGLALGIKGLTKDDPGPPIFNLNVPKDISHELTRKTGLYPPSVYDEINSPLPHNSSLKNNEYKNAQSASDAYFSNQAMLRENTSLERV